MSQAASSRNPQAITPRGVELGGAPPASFDVLATARRVLRSARSGAFATLDPASGFPLSTMVNLATDSDGTPLLLLSRLALHTRNVEADPRASLMFAVFGKGDPLAASERLSVVGRVERHDEPRALARLLSRHPKARLYAGFPDFALYRLTVEAAHLNGGFARAGSVTAEELLLAPAASAALAEVEQSELARLNAEGAGTLRRCATRSLGMRDGRWRATGLDPEGIDLILADQTARLVLPALVDGPEALRAALAQLEAGLSGAI